MWKFLYIKKKSLLNWLVGVDLLKKVRLLILWASTVSLFLFIFLLKVKFSCCIPDRGQMSRGERPCDTARDCQVIFSRLLIFWSSACIPQIGQLNRQRLNMSTHESLLLVQEGEVSVNAVLCRRIIFASLPTLNVTTDAYPISYQQCSSLR